MAKKKKDDGAGEFSFGSGLFPNPLRVLGVPGVGTVPDGRAGDGLTPEQRLLAMRMTDPANPDASEEDVWSPNVTQSHLDEDGVNVPGTLRSGVTQPVTEDGILPSSGQHARIDSGTYNRARAGYPAHEPDGLQDGEGREWRDSVPPNPIV